MTPEQFTYWLQGYSEISGDQPTEEEWQVIKDHLQTVFHKVTPDRRHPSYVTNVPTTIPNGGGYVQPLEITPIGTGKNPWELPYTTIC